MTKVEAILEQVRGLSAEEIAQLMAALDQQSAADPRLDELRTGQRGLAALTESTRDEDWSALYPEALRRAP